MAISEAQAYAGMNAAQLQSLAEGGGQKSDDVGNDKLKQVLQRISAKTQENKENVKEGSTKNAQQATLSKQQATFKSISEGKAGPLAKQALELLNDSPLGSAVNSQAKETFGDVTAKSGPAGFAAASAFSQVPAKGAPIASEAMVVLTQASTQGDKALGEAEKAIGEFVKSFGDTDVTPNAQKKFFNKAMQQPGGEAGATARGFAEAKTKNGTPLAKMMNAGAQETAANAFVKDPAKFKTAIQGLTDFANKPGILDGKKLGPDMKSNFSALSKVALGSEKLGITMEAQEKIFKSSKFDGMSADKRGQLIAIVGREPGAGEAIAKALDTLPKQRAPKLIARLQAEGTSPEMIAKHQSALGKPTIPFPPIGGRQSGEGGEGQQQEKDSQRGMIAFRAQWGRTAQLIEKHNNECMKATNKYKSLKDLQAGEVPRGFGPVIGEHKTAEQFAAAKGCSLDEAKYIFELAARCEDSRTEANKAISTKRRFLRSRPQERGEHKVNRSATANVSPGKATITLTPEQQAGLSTEFRNLVGSGTSKTQAPVSGGEAGASASAGPAAAAPADAATRNKQVMKPPGKALKVGGTGVMGWGNNTFAVGMDKETTQHLLAEKRAKLSEKLKGDNTQVARGPRIGRASDFVPLAQIVEAKTPWVQLSPAVKAAMRNLQITPNVLESWYDGTKRIYSSLQARPFDQLTEIQQKSAMLMGLQPDNWNALAGLLSTNVKANTPVGGKPTVHNVSKVASKAST